MRLLLKLAWRNVMRNRRRTVLSGLAVGIGLASMIFMGALFTGMFESMVRTATDTFLGQGQIHALGFRDALEVENTIHEPEALVEGLSGEAVLDAFTPRTISFGMLSSAAGANSVLLYGIAPETERELSVVDDAITEGSYLGPDDGHLILLGSKAAETLEAEAGDRLVLTVAQAGTGELSQDMFRVGGIFHMGIREADSGMAFIHIGRARELLALGDGIHEIALKFKDINAAGDPGLPFWDTYSRGGNEAIGWRRVVPQLDGVIRMSAVSKGITIFLTFGIVALIVMNTLFMSLYERIFEFGVLRAIGTRPTRMAAIVFLEAASLSLISMAIGAALGFAVTKYYSVQGIDYRGIEFAGVTITDLLYPVLKLEQFTLYPLLIFLFSLIAAVYPAVFAARLTPAKAMRKSL
jgi:ABC-type lipoprotein release transport system permease subunit